MDISYSMFNNKKKCYLEIYKIVFCEIYEFLKLILFWCIVFMVCIYISIYFDVCVGGVMFISIVLLINLIDDREKGS